MDGKLKLTKRKKTKKDIPPDLKAVQLLLANEEEGSLGDLSDEDLEAEKARLLTLLQKDGVTEKAAAKKSAPKTSEGKKGAAVKKTAKKTTTKKVAAKKKAVTK